MKIEIDANKLCKADRIRAAIELMQDFSVNEVAIVLNDVVYCTDMETLFELDYTRLDYSILAEKGVIGI